MPVNTGLAIRVMPSPKTPVSLAAASLMEGAATVNAIRCSSDSTPIERPIDASRLRSPTADRRCRAGLVAATHVRTSDCRRDNGMGHLRDRNEAENGRLGIWGVCVIDADDPTADTTP